MPHCMVDSTVLPVVASAKCLEYWWGRDLFASKSIEENNIIKKARWAFSAIVVLVLFMAT